MGSNITMVVTSCDRHDLLKRTLDSFICMQAGGLKPDACIIIEDGPTPLPDWLRENIRYYSSNLGKVQWLQNEARMGQIYSIDRAYSLVETDYIFHCEDDWDFVQAGFMQNSKEILDKHPSIIQVSLRGNCGWSELIDQPPYEGFKIAMPYWRGGWGGIAFNPGLRRMAEYRKIGSSYGRHTSYSMNGSDHEMVLSKMYLDMGYRMADLNRVVVRHSGYSCSRAVEKLETMPKVLIAISVCHRLAYTKWESSNSPQFDNRNGWNSSDCGTELDVSGENDRVAALRDTWLKDVEPFKSHVEYKLFYGTDGNRPAEPDEVFLGFDEYAGPPAKTIAICRWAREQDYDYIFLCDDNTGVYVDRIVHELISNRFDYAGYKQGSVCTGATGYWLSKSAYKIIAENASAANRWSANHWSANHGSEDEMVSKRLIHHGIEGVHLEGHRAGKADRWFYKDGYDPKVDMSTVSSFHAVQPKDMRDWHADLVNRCRAACELRG
jgi:hypothetical protein